MIIGIVNQKGGVGKTTTTVNLAAALRARALAAGDTRPVLIVDLDAQGNATKMSGAAPLAEVLYDALVDPEVVPLSSVVVPTALDGVFIAPGTRALAGLDSAMREVAGREVVLRELLEPICDAYAAIIIDNGPSLGLPVALALTAADIALVPVACDGPLALEGLQQVSVTIDQARRRQNKNLKRKILLTMVDGRNSHSRPLAASVRARMGVEVLQTELGHSADLQRGLFNRATGGAVQTYAPHSPAAGWFTALAIELT